MVEQSEQSGRQFAQSAHMKDVANVQGRAQLNDGRLPRARFKGKRPFHVEGNGHDHLRFIGLLFFNPSSKYKLYSHESTYLS